MISPELALLAGLPRVSAAGLRVALLCAAVFVWTGCASAPFSAGPLVRAFQAPLQEQDFVRMAPDGPGSVFPTIEAAAADALAYAYLASRATPTAQRAVRGGAIHPVPGGYSYDEPRLSSESAGGRVRYSLQPTDVAHYRHFPRQMHSERVVASSRLSRHDRRLVDRRDPLHRPLFYLTPSRRVHVYLGREDGHRQLGQIHHGVRRGDRALLVTSALQDLGGEPLALQPSMPMAR